VNIVRPWQGAWPAPDQALLIERASLAKTRASLGDTVNVQISGQDVRVLPIAGLTHDLSLPPAAIAGQAFGYITADTLAWLGGPAGYNQLRIVVAEQRRDPDHIRAVAAEVQRLVERGGREVHAVDVPTPLQHPAEVVLPTVLSILATLGALALVISAFLIVNTVGAILTQQTRQIGVMKAIGARAVQIAGLYFAMALSFGLLALLVAVPMSALAAFFLTRYLGSQLNIDILQFRPPPFVLLLQIGAALLVPVVAASVPIYSVATRPTREALAGASDAPVKATLVDRLIGAIRGLSRPTRLALRNTFRRKGRLARTLAALALGGAVFISVLTLNASLYTTLDASIASQRYDVEVQLGRLYRSDQTMAAAGATPGITHVESLRRDSALPVRADGSTGEALSLRALPADTAMFAPRMVSGRWLLPGDGNALVMTSNYMLKERGARIGDTIRLEIGGERRDWLLVGIAEELIPPTSPAWAYVPLEAYTALMGRAGRTDTLRITTVGHDAASHAAATATLERTLETQGFELRLIRSRSEDRAMLSERFTILTTVLGIMSLLIGAVGGLGLAGTMSINVLERTREIGVMRAIGASDGAVRQVVMSEGLAIAVLAWGIGTLLSLPMSFAMCRFFGTQLLNAPLSWVYSLPGVFGWLGIVLVIAAIASLLPARAAARLTVREVLAYE
jgi:putative ABC transport system permease protein